MFIAKLSNGMHVPMKNAEDHRVIEYGEHQIMDIYPDGEPDRDILKDQIKALTAQITKLEGDVTTLEQLRRGGRP